MKRIISFLLSTLLIFNINISYANKEKEVLETKEVKQNIYITRAEFIKMLVNILELDTNSKAKDIYFKDVGKDNRYYTYIKTAYNNNIIRGDGYNFYPNEKITREEMATIVSRAVSFDNINDSLEIEIKDRNKISDWAYPHVEKCIIHKLLIGDGYGNFHPKGYTTKEMATVVTIRAFEKQSKQKLEDIDR